jgi:hypothetical protein
MVMYNVSPRLKQRTFRKRDEEWKESERFQRVRSGEQPFEENKGVKKVRVWREESSSKVSLLEATLAIIRSIQNMTTPHFIKERRLYRNMGS